MSIFQWRLDGFSQKYISLYLYLGLFFENRKNSGLTPGQNDDPVTRTWKMTQMTHWPGDPMTQFHVWCRLRNYAVTLSITFQSVKFQSLSFLSPPFSPRSFFSALVPNTSVDVLSLLVYAWTSLSQTARHSSRLSTSSTAVSLLPAGGSTRVISYHVISEIYSAPITKRT